MSSMLWILPLVPTVVGLVMLGIKDRRLLNVLDVASTSTIAVLVWAIAQAVMHQGPLHSANTFYADAVTVVFLALIALLSATTAIYTIGWMRCEVASGGIAE